MYAIAIFWFILSGISFIAAAIFFFVFDIPTVIGDLSGRNAKKAIEDIKRHSKETGHLHKDYRDSDTSLSENHSPSNTPKSSVERTSSTSGASHVQSSNIGRNSAPASQTKSQSTTDIEVKNVRNETGVLNSYNPNNYKPNTSVLSSPSANSSGSMKPYQESRNNERNSYRENPKSNDSDKEEITKEVPSVSSKLEKNSIHKNEEELSASLKNSDERRNAEQAVQINSVNSVGSSTSDNGRNDERVTLDFSAGQRKESADTAVKSDVKDEKFKVVYELGFYESEEIIE